MDACMVGAGGFCEALGQYFRLRFPNSFAQQDLKITHLELWAVIVGVKLWYKQMFGKVIRVHTDNEAVAIIINTGRSKCNKGCYK